MSKGAALISIGFALIVGLIIGNVTAGPSGDDEGVENLAGVNVDGAKSPDASDRLKIPFDKSRPTKGENDALVTIIEYSDFECPFCSKVLPTLKQLQDKYGKNIRIQWRNNPLPFHKNAGPAANLAMEAHAQKGDDGFWKVHDLLFERTAKRTPLSTAELEKIAKEAGLDVGKAMQAISSKKYQGIINADMAVGRKFGVKGTPAFFINGRFLSGAQPFEKFDAVVSEEMATAQKLVNDGTPKSAVYEKLIASGKAKAAPPAPKQARKRPDPNAVYKMEITGKEPFKGNKNAAVTIVQFSDFECPFCARVEPTVDEVLEKYGKDVRVVWMNNPLSFHKHARPAANAAAEAYAQKGNKGFWGFHKKAFEVTAARGKLTNEKLVEIAKEVGLNAAKVRQAIESNKYGSEISKQQAAGAKLGARGTPAFFINGRFLSGAQPMAAFDSVIKEELKRAKGELAKGTPASKLYNKLIENGATSPKTIGAEPAAAAGGAEKTPAAPKQAAPAKGAKNAKVVIYEFSDFECPFCSRVNPSIKEVMEKYGDKVKIVWRDHPLPFHKNAPLAHQAAREVFEQGGDAKFWAYHDILFANQKALTRENLEAWAAKVGGINMAKFRKALDSGKHAQTIQEGAKAIRSAGITRFGTPTFFVGEQKIAGAQPFATFEAAIKKELAK